MRRFTPDERVSIKAAAAEDKLAGLLMKIGGLRGMVVGGATGVVTGPIGGALAGGGMLLVGATGRGMTTRSARSAAQAAQSFAAAGTLPVMTPSARARAFGSAFTLGTGLAVGRDFSGGTELPEE